MTPLLNYLYEASIALALLYLPFIFIGRKNTFHKTNRTILISSLILSVCLPFINIPVHGASGVQGILQLQEVVITSGNTSFSGYGYNISHILLPAYITVSAIFLLLSIGKTARIFIINRDAIYTRKKGFTLVCTDQKTSPFSLFKYIFINKNNYSEKDIRIIIRHEQEHILHYHFLDNILVEIIRILFWFHPAVYLFLRSLKIIHEYQADLQTVQHTDRSNYLRLIYSETLRPHQIGITNHFSYSPLKRRLKMMLTKPTKRYAGLYYLTWIPVAALLVFFLGTTELNAQTQSPKAVVTEVSNSDQTPLVDQNKQEESVFVIVEERPNYPGGQEALFKFFADNIVYPERAKIDSISGTVFIEFIIEKDGKMSNIRVVRGVHPSLDNEAIRVLKLMPAWNPGKQKGKAVRVKYTLPIKFTL